MARPHAVLKRVVLCSETELRLPYNCDAKSLSFSSLKEGGGLMRRECFELLETQLKTGEKSFMKQEEDLMIFIF